MTSPTSVGAVSIEVMAELKGLVKQIRSEMEKGFKGLDFSKAIQDAVSKTPIKVPVEADTAPLEEKVRKTRIPKIKVPLDPDVDGIPEKVRKTRIPKVPVTLDPVLAAFQQEVRRQTAALSKQAIKIPVDGDTTGLRAELSTQLAAIQTQSRIKVPTEPGDKAAYEARLKAQLAEVARRVKQSVDVDVDVDKGGASRALGDVSASGLSGIAAAFQKVSAAASGAAGSAVQFGGSLVGAATTASGPVGIVVGVVALLGAAIAGMTSAVVAGVPAISALAGAVAALPALLAGAAAGFGALKLGFSGIADAFNPKPSGGGGGGGGEDPASRARRIAGAERGVEAARRGIAAATRGVAAAERGYQASLVAVADAQKRAAQAQAAINRARVDARENIEDLTRSLAGAKLSEEDATLGVTEALRALNAARETGQLPDIQRADLAYRQAIQTLAEAKDTTEDLGTEQADAAKKGVEGSDLVQGALDDHVEALKAVKDAQAGVVDAQNGLISANDGLKSSYDGLKSAQDALAEANKKTAAAGGGGGALAEVVKLAPSAQKFVDAIKALKPAFESLRLDVQQRLFAGLDKTVTRLGEAWIPALRTTLGSYADTFNGFFKTLGASISQPKFITDIQAGAEGARQGLSKIFDAITAKLVPAFGALSRAAGPFLTKLGEEIAGVVTKFSEWVLAGEKSGGLTRFFDRAAEAMHDIFETGTQVGRIIGSLFEIITGSQATSGQKSPLDAFNDALRRVADWLADPANQAKVQSFIAGIQAAVLKVSSAIQTVSGWVDTVQGWAARFEAFKTRVGEIFDEVVGFFQALPNRVVGFIQALPERVSAIFSALARRAGEIVGYGIGVVAGFFYRLPGQIWNFIKSIPDRVRGLFNSVVSVAKSLPGRFMSAVSSISKLPGQIWNWLSGIGSTLWTVGQNAIIGLWNGILSMGSWLRDKVVNFAAGVIDGFKRGFDSHSPSRRMADEVGVTLPQGIAAGMKAARPALLRDVKGMADEVASAALPQLQDVSFGLGVEGDAAISRALSVAGTSKVQLEFASGFTGDWLVDGLRKNIKFSHRGDPMAALGTS